MRSILVVLLAAAPAAAQTPAGLDFRVNTATTGDQREPTVTAAPGGEFVVGWSDAGGIDYDAVARRFAADGAPLGAGFRLNSYTTNAQLAVSLSADRRGGFAAGWVDIEQRQMAVRRFDAAGQPRTGELPVTTVVRGPRLASAGDGSFVVVWTTFAPPNQTFIRGRRFGPDGDPRGAEFQVNNFTTGFMDAPGVASAPDGRFVVAWLGSDGYSYGVRARRFAASNAPLGAEFMVNTYTTGYQWWLLGNQDHVVSMADDGSFVVAWQNNNPSPLGDEVFARVFDGEGVAAGPEFQVNTLPARSYPEPRVAMNGAGDFVVAWSSNYPGMGVAARRYDPAGIPRGPQVLVNTDLGIVHTNPQVASDRAGNLVVAWVAQDGSGTGVYARRFGGLLPAALTVSDNGNGVLEAGDTFTLVTSWRNATGAAQTFQGRRADVSAPAGLTLTLSADAGYTAASGATAACGICFAGNLGGTRPGGHVDASVLERILPDAQGQAQRWRLHVGDSFADVPRASPFYRFVETLLHQGVAAGCGASSYCPAAAATREQMAPFVLAAREGAGYVPRPCTTPIFTDVPASSPFCPFIEELARRGVAGGCGPGLYCPTAAVTREQMAVFVLRTLDPALSPPACVAGSEAFADVPASSSFCRWIEELARRGVVAGCGGGNYCPAAAITREQMSAFLTGTFGLTLYGP